MHRQQQQQQSSKAAAVEGGRIIESRRRVLSCHLSPSLLHLMLASKQAQGISEGETRDDGGEGRRERESGGAKFREEKSKK